MDKSSIYKLAERYLAGKLSEEERDSVDEKLETDKEFGLVFARYLVVRQKTDERMRVEWKKELMALFDDDKKEKKGRMLNLRWLSAVAAVFLLAFATFWLWNNQSSPDSLYADAASATFQSRIIKLEGRSTSSNFITLFENQDFTKALSEAEKQYSQADAMDKLLWQERKGFSLWQLEKWPEALAVFQELEKNTLLLPHKNPALWYQALTYLGQKDTKQCKNTLQKITALPQHDYKEKARKMLAELYR